MKLTPLITANFVIGLLNLTFYNYYQMWGNLVVGIWCIFVGAVYLILAQRRNNETR